MSRYRVWVRSEGDFCRVRVDGKDNVKRLLDSLSRSFVFRTFEPVVEDSPYCTFQVPCNPPLSHARLSKLLSTIPEVCLMREPV
jgi:hypothetical protein